MTNIDVNGHGAGPASDGFEFNIENCQFNENTIAEGQVVRLLSVPSGSTLSTCFTGNAIGSKLLVSADTGSSMACSDLFGEGNSAPAWTCDVTDCSLGVARCATTIADVGDGAVEASVYDCPNEGFIFDADSCPVGDGEDGGDAPAPPPSAAPPPTAGPPPVATEPPPAAGVAGDCKVCPDGSALTTPTRLSQRFGSTCQDLEASAMAFMEGRQQRVHQCPGHLRLGLRLSMCPSGRQPIRRIMHTLSRQLCADSRPSGESQRRFVYLRRL